MARSRCQSRRRLAQRNRGCPAPGATGSIAFRRNPSYVAVAVILLDQFLIFPNWIISIYLAAAVWLFHRQVLRKERPKSKLTKLVRLQLLQAGQHASIRRILEEGN